MRDFSRLLRSEGGATEFHGKFDSMHNFSFPAHINPQGLLPDPSKTNIFHKDEYLGHIRFSMGCGSKSLNIFILVRDLIFTSVNLLTYGLFY